jgi:hypothetical protein
MAEFGTPATTQPFPAALFAPETRCAVAMAP